MGGFSSTVELGPLLVSVVCFAALFGCPGSLLMAAEFRRDGNDGAAALVVAVVALVAAASAALRLVWPVMAISLLFDSDNCWEWRFLNRRIFLLRNNGRRFRKSRFCRRE